MVPAIRVRAAAIARRGLTSVMQGNGYMTKAELRRRKVAELAKLLERLPPERRQAFDRELARRAADERETPKAAPSRTPRRPRSSRAC